MMKNLKPFGEMSEAKTDNRNSEADQWIKSVMGKSEMLSPFLIDYMDEMESYLTLDLAHEVMAKISHKNPENVHEAAVMAALKYVLSDYIDTKRK